MSDKLHYHIVDNEILAEEDIGPFSVVEKKSIPMPECHGYYDRDKIKREMEGIENSELTEYEKLKRYEEINSRQYIMRDPE